ncbi:beta-phosphoglucomutase [Tichowtungia aerotolerans]|uniref:Beta-phosphoglucomutase n=1 Tax=Tichowtungia aerotolerans TaxID=2697043 RepID=A0A6P1M767_9BACT|nr:beta-phosphoglucomutase [Tichowtungia aerotolerans]QHI68028.1 beta-phosphoglucomutase [Tichowtungia aerotolerans]
MNNLQTIRAALFDLDGVVCFTDHYHYLAWKEMADAQGWDFNETINHQLRGIPREASLEVILNHNGVTLDPQKKQELAHLKNERYKELLQQIDSDALYPGIVEFITALRERGVKIALGSSSKNAGAILDKLSLTVLFDAVVTGNDIEKPKPDPEIFLKGAELLGIHPFNCVVFEDAESGVEAGLQGGMKVVGVGTPATLPNAPTVVRDYQKDIDLDTLLQIGKPARISAHPWEVVEDTFVPGKAGYWESIFALSNGVLGLRGAIEENSPNATEQPGMFINGIYAFSSPKGYPNRPDGTPPKSQVMLNLCDWRPIDLFIGGEKVDVLSEHCSEHNRTLNMKTGILTRSFVWNGEEGAVRVTLRRLVSMTRRHNAAIELTLEALDRPLNVSIESRVFGKSITGQFGLDGTTLQNAEIDKDAATLQFKTLNSGLSYSASFSHSDSCSKNHAWTQNDADLCYQADLSLTPGTPYRLEKHAAFVSCMDEGDPAEDVRQASADGFETLAAEQTEYWRRVWEQCDVKIEGSVEDQQAIRYNIFQLHQNHPMDMQRSISATGVTGANYMGWIFWDTEMFMAPLFTYTAPERTRALLAFRYGQLDGARRIAKNLGRRGALWPWSTINGDESNADPYVSTAQYHIVADVAHALHRYWQATGDDDFLFAQGAEMLFETCRLIASIGCFVPNKGNRYCINTVCGPDEYNFPVNNNCYTNLMFKWQLEFAQSVLNRMAQHCPERLAELQKAIGLTEEETAEWKTIAEQMYVPTSETLGIYKQDDQYLDKYPVDMSTLPRNYEFKKDVYLLSLLQMQVSKQADVVQMLFTLSERFTPEQKKANYDFYEPRTTHASSLSPCVHGITAAEIGYTEEALNYWKQSVLMDLDDCKNNTSSGIHLACSGGAWMMLMFGFLGMRTEENRIQFSPRIPKEWDGIETSLIYQGTRFNIKVTPDQTDVTWTAGPALQIQIRDTQKNLSSSEKIFSLAH